MIAFWIAATVTVAATGLALTRRHPVHALLNLVVSFFGISVVFLIVGAPLVAMLELIVYAGAIVVLYLFVVMLLDLGREEGHEIELLRPRAWATPAALSAVLLFELLGLDGGPGIAGRTAGTSPDAVGRSLLSEYLLAVELAAMLLLAALVAAGHLGRRHGREEPS